MTSSLQFLLSLDPLKALVRMVNDANGTNYRLDRFTAGVPTALAGTTTSVVLTGMPAVNTFDDQTTIGTFTLTYDRLDMSLFLSGLLSTYHPVLPLSTQNILDEITALIGQKFTIDDMVLEEVTRDNGGLYRLKAKPESLRFVGYIDLPLITLTPIVTLFDPKILITVTNPTPVVYAPSAAYPYLNATNYRTIANGFAPGDLGQNKANLVSLFNGVVGDPTHPLVPNPSLWSVRTTPGPYNLYNAAVVGYTSGLGVNPAIPTLETALQVKLDPAYCTNFTGDAFLIPYTMQNFELDGYTALPRSTTVGVVSLSDGTAYARYLNGLAVGTVITSFQTIPPVDMEGSGVWHATNGLPGPTNLYGAIVTYNGQVRATDLAAATAGLDRVLEVQLTTENSIYQGLHVFYYTSPIVVRVIPLTTTLGSAYQYSFVPTAGQTPYTYAVTGGSLPPGLTLDPATGLLSGTATAAGAYQYDLTITDGFGTDVVFTFNHQVNAAIDFLQLTGVLPNAVVNVAYSQFLNISGGLAPYGTPTRVSGNLPDTILLETLYNTVRVYGTWTVADTYYFAIGVTSADGQSISQTFQLTVSAT